MERYRKIVAEVDNHFVEISLEDAKKIRSESEIGEDTDNLPPLDFGRIAAQSDKVITQKVREAERARQYEEFKDKLEK